MNAIVASAPGKLMLFGEHAVLYKQPCIVSAVSLRMRVKVEVNKTNYVSIKSSLSPDTFMSDVSQVLSATTFPKEVRFILFGLKKFWKHSASIFGVDIETSSEFTYSYGLGSSSAVTVALVKALSVSTGQELSDESIFNISYEASREAQGGRGSGFDVAAATYGGTILYEVEGKTLERIELPDLPILACYSGVKASTVEYVKKVEGLLEENEDAVISIMNNIGKIVTDAHHSLINEDYEKVGYLMGKNQELLRALNVSTPALETLIEKVLSQGAQGAKLSGAGGGDCIIALVNNIKRDRIVDSIRKSGILGAKVLDLKIGDEGVRIETDSEC